ncbi:universal stress protein [Vibrio sp. HN007]|uniref:universal stress protein n=1 Tax=Vibrio iocasae TaxID=3098914 RepID=UPI0035D49C3F
MIFNNFLLPLAYEQDINHEYEQLLKYADICSGNVTLLTVIENLDEINEIAKYSVSALNILEESRKKNLEHLETIVSGLNGQYPNIKFHISVRTGIAFVEIIKAAKEVSASLIVIKTRDGSDKGSNTLHLMRKSEVPIWAVNSSLGPAKKVVVAVDVGREELQEFNFKLVKSALDLSSVYEAELVLCHAWQLEHEGFLRKWERYEDLDIALLMENMRDDRIARLQNIVEVLGAQNNRVNYTLLEGNARESIPQFVARESVDMVVLGSMSRTGIAGFLMGNTAESLLNKIDCSVLTLKPDDFNSPVLKN